MKTYFYTAALIAASAGTALAQTAPQIVKPAPPVLTAPKPSAVQLFGQLFGRGDLSIYSSLDGYDGGTAETQVERLRKQLEAATREMQQATAYRDMLARSDKAMVSDTNTADKLLSDTTAKVELIRKQLNRAERTAPLQQKVDVKFDNATVAQATQALTDASGFAVVAAPGIPDTTRLTVEARRVRLATVLESVARQAGLIIEPDGLDGSGTVQMAAVLTLPPMLRVNDTVQNFPPSPSPWSAAWGTSPTNRVSFALGQVDWNNARISAFVNGFTAARGGAARSRATFPDGTTGELGYAKAATVTLTEPGKNERGESGAYRSVYVLKNGAFVRESRTWTKR